MTPDGIKGSPIFSIPSNQLKPCASAIGKQNSQYSAPPFDKAMNIIFNVALGGGFPLAMPNPPTACSCMLNDKGGCAMNLPWQNQCACKGYDPNFSMDIEQVRVWEH